MNKTKLIDQVADLTRLPKGTCKEVVETFIDVVSTSLKQGKTVVITGFGTFSVMKRKSRTGVNPATGKKMTIPARKVAKFRAGKALKELID